MNKRIYIALTIIYHQMLSYTYCNPQFISFPYITQRCISGKNGEDARRDAYNGNFRRDICMGGQSRTIEERKIDGRSSVADYSVAGHGSDTSIDKSFSVPSALRSPPTRKRVRSKCVAAMRFTISRARGPRFVKKILLSSPRKTKKKERSLLEGREREREGKRCVPIILSASVRNIIL